MVGLFLYSFTKGQTLLYLMYYCTTKFIIPSQLGVLTNCFRQIIVLNYAGLYHHNEELFTNIYPRIVPDNIYQIVKTKISQNQYGKHLPDVCYLLKFKVKCGYCGKQVNSDAGTGKKGQVKRYYKCAGKRKDKTCNLASIRKELLEKIVIDTTYEALKGSQIENLAERILEAHNKRIEDQSVLNLLSKDFDNISKSINNLIAAMEQGIVTASTKERLEVLEEHKMEIANKIAMEKSKDLLRLTKEEIIWYMKKAIKKEPKQMIDLLIKEVLLYNDKVEIFYNYTDRQGPDGDDRQVFSFYTTKKHFVVDTWKMGQEPVQLDYEVTLLV